MKKVFTFLMTAAALLLISAGAMAQDGETPFVGSTHVYTVTPANGSNTLAWSVLEGSDGTQYDINSGAATSTLNITWNVAGTYTLQFTETNTTTSCATVKQLTVVVSANTFDVTAVAPAATCNAADGEINYSETDVTTEVSFLVEMATGDTGFNPNWAFTFTLSSTTGATIGDVTDGTNTITPDGSNIYTLTGLSSADGAGSVTIYLDATGELYSAEEVVLTITSAKELTYNTPDVDSDDWTATQTINPIPNTSGITTD